MAQNKTFSRWSSAKALRRRVEGFFMRNIVWAGEMLVEGNSCKFSSFPVLSDIWSVMTFYNSEKGDLNYGKSDCYD